MEHNTTFHEFYSACCSSLMVSTTGPLGGDGGHGAYTRLIFQDEGGSCWSGDASQTTEPGELLECVRRVVFEVFGDAEQQNLLAALEAAARAMRAAGVRTFEEEIEAGDTRGPQLRLVREQDDEDDEDDEDDDLLF